MGNKITPDPHHCFRLRIRNQKQELLKRSKSASLPPFTAAMLFCRTTPADLAGEPETKKVIKIV
jgi:hypothetical protein